MTELRFGGYSIEWQRGGLRQVLDMQWMEPVWAAHYRRTSAAVRPPHPPDSTPSFTLMLWCPVSVCVCVCVRVWERERDQQQNKNNTHPHRNTHLPSTVAGIKSGREAENIIRKNRCIVCYLTCVCRGRNDSHFLICCTLYRVWLFVNHIFQLVISKTASCWMH